MGEKEPEKTEGEKKSGGAETGAVTVVLKVDLHCEGCAQKVKKNIKHLKGVESVKTDFANNKVTVVGKVNPATVKQKVEEKIKKKVELVSPQPPKKDKEVADTPAAAPAPAPAPPGDAKKPEEKKPDEKKPEEKPEKKAEDTKKAEEKKPPPVVTVVLKTRVHCDGCAYKIEKIVKKYEGVDDVKVDLAKDQITVNGTMDMKEMLPYLSAKLKRSVDIVPPPAKKDDGGDKKPKEGGGDGGDKKGKEDSKPDKTEGDGKPVSEKSVEQNVAKVEIVNKMEHYGYPSHGYGSHSYNPYQASENGYVSEYWHGPQYMNAPPQYSYGYPQHQYMPGPSYVHQPPPQMFSDENPNACSVM